MHKFTPKYSRPAKGRFKDDSKVQLTFRSCAHQLQAYGATLYGCRCAQVVFSMSALYAIISTRFRTLMPTNPSPLMLRIVHAHGEQLTTNVHG